MKTTLNQMREAVENKTAQLLTLEAAEQLKGKKIATIYFGYRGQDGIAEFVVGEVIVDNSYINNKPLCLLTAEGENTFIRAHKENNGIFSCSDSDRFVYFIEISSIVEKHTVVFEKIIKDNRPNPISSAAKFLKSINHNDFTFETTTDMWAALTFNTEKEAQVIKTNLESCGHTVDVYSYGTPDEN
jgi:hypothetical protein